MSENLDTLLSEWPFETVVPEDGEAVHDGLTVIADRLDTIDDDIQWLDEQRRVQTATGAELEKLANEVGIKRQQGETDERLRFRTLIAKASTRSDGTFDDIAQVLLILFGDDVSKISLDPVTGEPTIYLSMPQSLVDDIPLTESEFATALDDILPISDPIEVYTDDTLIFGESGSQGFGGELS
jgi:hypothetical protein